jgi:hypothetical protein
MTTTRTATAPRLMWQTMLPTDRTYVAVPSRRMPLIVAERDRGVLTYVRERLLARPPRSRASGWTYAAARQALRVNAVWALVPGARPAVDGNLWLDQLVDTLMRDRRILLLNHNRDPEARFVMLLFTAGECSPSVAVKVADVTVASRLRDEEDLLRCVADLAPTSLRPTIPAVLHLEHRAQPILATTAQRGTSMLVAMNRGIHTRSRAAVQTDFAAASFWLAVLQSKPTGPAAQLDIQTDTIEAACRQLADSPVLLSDVVDGLLALQRRLRRGAVAQTVVHGDYWPGNLLLDRRTLSGVIDWERAEPAGSPVRDLARLAVAYSTYLDRHTRPGRRVAGHRDLLAGAPGGGVTYAMDGTGWYPALVRRYLTEGLKRLDLPPAFGRDVMLAEVAAIAAEATDSSFARGQWRVFRQGCAGAPP